MCRSRAEGGRRCPGGHTSSRDAQTARQRLCRARRALEATEATGDAQAIAAAHQRVADAQEGVTAARILAGADQPDPPNAAGLYRAERQALSAYTGGESASINQFVQNGYQVPDHLADDRDYVRLMRQQVAALKRAVNRSKLTTQTKAAQAVPAAVAEQIYGPVGSGVGQTVTQDRFVSLTVDHAPSEVFGDVFIYWHLPVGTRALDVNASGVPCKRDERELLLGPHQPFLKARDELIDGRRVIHMEGVLPPATPRPRGQRAAGRAANI
ncbi:hypothetical protein OHA25_60985 (plasmid) [Nonomuraea sp. NBC_00507]|uniref:hypothetical protein n=1 Tax=Nonomuraea sp. NBC_00507 TaxID=2976002 RepID=UPI002E1825FF